MAIWKRVALALLVVLIVGLSYFRWGNLPPPLPEHLQSAQMLEPGPHCVAYFDVLLEDDTRPTQANGKYAGSDSRQLQTRVWYPADLASGQARRPLPLVIYSHGFMSRRNAVNYKAEHLVSHGYIVASMDFPLTNLRAPGGAMVKDVVNQPLDVSFLLDQMLDWSEDPDNLLYGMVDEERVGAFGLSLGGLTTTLLAYHPRLGDARFRAAISIAGPSFMFGPRFYQHAELPFMMLATPTDAMVEYETNARPILDSVGGALLVTLEDASHAGFDGLARHMRWYDNMDSVGCRQLQGAIAEQAEEDAWFDLIGTPEEGVLHVEPTPLCEMDPLPAVMNPVHQHRLTTLAVTAFFQSQFADTTEERVLQSHYLMQVLPAEFAEVTVEFNTGFERFLPERLSD